MCVRVFLYVPHCGLLDLRRQLCEIRFLHLPSLWILELNSDNMVCVAITFICWAISQSITSNFTRKKSPDIPFPHCLVLLYSPQIFGVHGSTLRLHMSVIRKQSSFKAQSNLLRKFRPNIKDGNSTRSIVFHMEFNIYIKLCSLIERLS